MSQLAALGWTSSHDDAFRPYEKDHIAGRVAVEHRGMYVVYTQDGEVWAETTGRMRHLADDRSELPAVGDFVCMRPRDGEDKATIDAVLPRSSAFVRMGAGTATGGQVLAANIDFVWITVAMTRGLSARRVERFLSVAWNSGAQPVVVLTKADVGEVDRSRVAEVEQTAVGADVIVTSSVTGDGLDELRVQLAGNRTAALLGSSGVGKSSLINALVGEERLEVKATDNVDVGRHTSVRRELVSVPTGGLLIDTPGLRELVAWHGGDAGDAGGFADVEALLGTCRFNDCAHKAEPGCAIQGAIAAGDLTAERYQSYLKMKRELRMVAGRKRGKEAIKVKHKVQRLVEQALEKAENE